ncbi:MAG TPA: response regulator [Pyrinomonadaceae bacterium]|nr:response regulator [Pyrinomonadaceae bacterium]
MRDQGADQKANILVVDDDPAVGDALKLVLEAEGYSVVLVDRGRDGIIQTGSARFDIGIVDLFLSDVSGLQVIKEIRELDPEVMLILITGQGTPQAFSEAHRLGVVGILNKPFRPDDIRRLVSLSLVQ